MQEAFLERFYSSQRTVGITELTQTMQRGNEKAADFINRWRNLSLHCSQPITVPEAFWMCMNNLSPDMAIHLQGVRPITFEELSSKATDIEKYMNHVSRPSRAFSKSFDKNNQRGKQVPSKPKQMQAMEATIAPHKFQTGDTTARLPNKGGASASRRPTVSERQNQKYSFPAEEVEDLFMGLQNLELIGVFPIGVFEDDEESLHFPEEETLEVDEVKLRSGRQLAKPPPPQKDPLNVTPSDVADHTHNVSVKYDAISHLKKIPVMLSVYDDLCLSSELRNAFISALSFPKDYKVEASQAEIKDKVEVSQAEVKLPQTQSISFSDDDLLLGNKMHNRPLLMFGEIDDLPINRIMIDGGSAINLLPLRTLKKIGYSKGDLCRSNVVIHDFNQLGQEALGAISLILKLKNFTIYVKFHIIDAATSYNALIGRPWLHESGVIPSTLHQCIKYKYQSGDIVRIFADKKPFAIAETFYADAKFYFEPVDKISKPKSALLLEQNFPKIKDDESSSSQKIYRYIPSNQRKKGDPIFRIINKKASQNRGISFPTPLPPLVQHKIKPTQIERGNKNNKMATQVTFLNRDDKALPISLYDNKVLYIMQQMGYDISTGPSLCDSRGQLAPFKKLMSQAQFNALHQDEVLKEEKYGLGYEVNMISTKPLDATEAPS
jgi:hypothetical protein